MIVLSDIVRVSVVTSSVGPPQVIQTIEDTTMNSMIRCVEADRFFTHDELKVSSGRLVGVGGALIATYPSGGALYVCGDLECTTRGALIPDTVTLGALISVANANLRVIYVSDAPTIAGSGQQSIANDTFQFYVEDNNVSSSALQL